jgi:hypothetical protein
VRNAWRKRRAFLIHAGNVPEDPDELLEELPPDEPAPTPQAPTP